MPKTKPLPSTVNSPAIEKKVLKVVRAQLGGRRFTAPYEHGQWWVECTLTGAQWSVHDTQDGFCFERVTEGEEG